MDDNLAILFAVGACAGTLAGLLGIGGGIVIVPLLAMVFARQGVDIAVLMHVAIGTSLATIVITSLASTWAHHRHSAVLWQVFRSMAPGIVTGSLLGAVIADAIPGERLRLVFTLFMFVVALRMAQGAAAPAHHALPGRSGMFGVSAAIGAVSAIMGIGGGTMSVPFLTWCNTPVRNAVATSAAIGIPIAVAGAAGFVIMGWDAPALPPWSVGYVNLPAFTGIVIASILFAPLGARLAHRIPELALKRLFALFIVVVALRMLSTG